MPNGTDAWQEGMQRAIETALAGVESGEGGPFGAVVMQGTRIVAVGHNEVVRRNDPTAHAEIVAIRKACKKLGRFDLSGCWLVCTGEPCPMCFSAIHWARLDRVVYCTTREEAAEIGFDDVWITQILRKERPDPIPFLHRPQSRCRELLRRWAEKPDKVPY